MQAVQVTLPSTMLPADAVSYFTQQAGLPEGIPFTVTVKEKPDGSWAYHLAPYAAGNTRLATPSVAYNHGDFGVLVRGTLPPTLGEEILTVAVNEIHAYQAWVSNAEEALRIARQVPQLLKEMEAYQGDVSSLAERLTRLEEAFQKHVRGMNDAYARLTADLGRQEELLGKAMRDVNAIYKTLHAALAREGLLEENVNQAMSTANEAGNTALHALDTAEKAFARTTTLEGRVNGLEETMTGVQGRMETLTTRIGRLENTVHQIEEAYVNLAGNVAYLEEALRAMRAHLYPKVARNTTATEELSERVRTLEGYVTKNTQAIRELGERVGMNEEAVRRVSEQYQQFATGSNTRLTTLEEEVRVLTEKVGGLQRENTGLKIAVGVEGAVLLAALVYALRRKR